jgi:hypothetical protein
MPKWRTRVAAIALIGATNSLFECRAALAQALSKEEEALPSQKEVAKLQALTPTSVKASIVIHDDDLETIATFSTANAYSSKGRFTDHVRSDNFLRAFIDKRTGVTRFQVYQEISYNYANRDFTTVNFSTPGGPLSAAVDLIGHDIVACFGSMCSFKDSIGFNVDESVLRATASQYVPGDSPYWRFRYHGRAGIDWNDRMMPAEAAGLLAVVDAWRAAHSRTGN